MVILLIEDNESIIKGLEYSFSKTDYEMVVNKCLKDTIEYLEKNKPDVILLDVSLPDGNGFDLYQKNILHKNIPTIFLTALDDEENIVKGLDMGAEDYITKPFSTKELLARINKVILRSKQRSIIKVKDITFDLDKMSVYKDANQIELSSLELKILQLLFVNLNHVVMRETILERIWDWTGNDVDDHTVTVYLKRIREKIKSDIIVTIKGLGYRIDGE